MRSYFLRFILWWMHYDLAMTKQRMQECQALISHDESIIHHYEIELMELEAQK